MTGSRHRDGFEVAQDLEFQRHQWKVQRIGWAVMIGVVLAALVGLFGDGPLSDARARGQTEALELEYERFVRHGRVFDIVVRLHPAAVSGGKIRLWVDRAYLRPLLLEGIIPEPEVTRLDGEGVIYQFAASGEEPTEAVFRFDPTGYGTNRGQIGLAGRPPISFSQFIYP